MNPQRYPQLLIGSDLHVVDPNQGKHIINAIHSFFHSWWYFVQRVRWGVSEERGMPCYT